MKSIGLVKHQNIVQVIKDKNTYLGHCVWSLDQLDDTKSLAPKSSKKQAYIEAHEIQMFVINHYMSQTIMGSFLKLELFKEAY